MTTWAMGYAKKAGMQIRSDSGEKLRIKSRPIGNMFAPDAEELRENFFNALTQEDVVISPSGSNFTYLAGAYAACGNVHWIDPGKLAAAMENGFKGKHAAVALLELFRNSPTSFYRYEPMDARVSALRLATQNWLAAEQQVTADSNAHSQLLKRERDAHYFGEPDKNAWILEQVKGEMRKLTARNRKAGVTLNKEQKADMERTLTARASELYDKYFGDNAKEVKKAQDALIRDRLEYYGIDELCDEGEKRIVKLLGEIEENALFEGLVGPGAIKTRAQILSYMRNPLFYPTFPQLAHYAGVGKLIQGQAARRKRGERQYGSPDFKRALCFDFADKYANADPIGFFSALYYTYKAHQYYRYWPLMGLTKDLWAQMGKKFTDDDETDDALSDEEFSDIYTDGLRDIVDGLAKIANLPVIGKNARVMDEIAALRAMETPDPKRVWLLFSKSNDGLNLQMTPNRVEKQTKRFMGTVLLQAVYYRWLAKIGRSLPLEADHLYLLCWRTIEGKNAAVPTSYDHEVVLMGFQLMVEELKSKVKLPQDVALKLIPKKDRPKEEAAAEAV